MDHVTHFGYLCGSIIPAPIFISAHHRLEIIFFSDGVLESTGFHAVYNHTESVFVGAGKRVTALFVTGSKPVTTTLRNFRNATLNSTLILAVSLH